MVAWTFARTPPESLTARIKAAERQLASRRLGLDARAAGLVRTIHQRMTSPTSLLLAGGIGFLTGELTRRRSSEPVGTADASGIAPKTPLKSAISLIAAAHTLYTALPVAWLMKSVHHAASSGRPPEAQCPPASPTPDQSVKAGETDLH
jgi:hypothetical protein